MNRKLFSITLTILVALLLGVAGSIAQGSRPLEEEGTLGTVDTTFTFQGHLGKDGGAVNDDCDFRFSLYDDPSAGGQIGATLNKNGVEVRDGKFTVHLDFGDGVFEGAARYLQVAVKCSGDTGFVGLTGRVSLTATPYALSLMPGAIVGGKLGDSTVLSSRNRSTNGKGPALSGEIDSTSTNARAVLGQVNSASPGAGSAGVIGINLGTGGNGSGVQGTHSGSGMGVFGTTSEGTGVYGVHQGTSGTEAGVQGDTNSRDTFATGVLGQVTSTSPEDSSAGVRGINQGTADNGMGVYGEHFGYGIAVYGTVRNGTGVYGYHKGSTGSLPGVRGATNSREADATGVLGEVAWHTPGSYSAGVRGINNGLYGKGIGVYGEQKGSGWGVYGKSDSGYAGWFASDIFVAGSCTGCALAYVGLNDSDEPLETGDLVAVSGVGSPLLGTMMPVLLVRRAEAGSTGAVVGVVASRAQSAGVQSDGSQEIDNVVRAEGPAAPGEYVVIVVQGLAQVKVDAGRGSVQAGDALTVAGLPAGYSGLALLDSTAPQVGRAMESMDQGAGLIWVMVDLH